MGAPDLSVASNSPAAISTQFRLIAQRVQKLDSKGDIQADAIPDNAADTTGNAATSDHALTADTATLAAAATKLATPRAINGTNFDGTAAITVTAAASTLTGTTLAANVVKASISHLDVWTLTPFANNAAAIAGGLVQGDLYRTGADPDFIATVH